MLKTWMLVLENLRFVALEIERLFYIKLFYLGLNLQVIVKQRKLSKGSGKMCSTSCTINVPNYFQSRLSCNLH